MAIYNAHVCFSECTKTEDCPYGGTNFLCQANKCECPFPMMMEGEKCVGKLLFKWGDIVILDES